MDDDLLKAILIGVVEEEEPENEYKPSTKRLLARLSNDYDSETIGCAIETLIDEEEMIWGRPYPPREGESFKFYVYMSLTLKGQQRLRRFTERPKPVHVDLFD